MRRRRKTAKKVRTAEQRAAARQATRACRDRARKGFACFVAAIDAEAIDKLIREGYLRDDDALSRQQVNRGLSALIWDWAHGLPRKKS